MSNFILKEVILETIRELEESGDIVISTTVPSEIINKLDKAIQEVSPNLLSTEEYSALINAANLTCSGFHVDDLDFQTHVGITRDQLSDLLKKLGNSR